LCQYFLKHRVESIMLIRHWTHPTFGAVALGPAVSFRLPNFALGLAFEQISLKSQTLLRQWLLQASGEPVPL
jgi:hypothetical protein